jgi:large-conductance mechanosensitive channel
MGLRLLAIDLRRFLRRESVVDLAAAFALGTTAVTLISTVVNSLVVFPVRNSNSGLVGGESGTFAIDHRVFDYEDVLFELLIAALVVAAVMAVVRLSRETLFGDKTFRECPHCLAEIPVGASVCSFCTRTVG